MIYLYRFTLYERPVFTGHLESDFGTGADNRVRLFKSGPVIKQEWLFTSHDVPVTFLDEVPAHLVAYAQGEGYPGVQIAGMNAQGFWEPVTFVPQYALTHAGIRFDDQKNAGQLSVTVARDSAIAGMFLAGYPYGSIGIRILELDEGIATTVFSGRVRSAAFEEQIATLTCTNGTEMLQRVGLRYNAGPNCQHVLFSATCGVKESLYTHTGTVLAISDDGLQITTDTAQADGYFKVGKFFAANQARMVTGNSAGVLTLMTALSGLRVGDTFTATKGCDRSGASCKSFGNYSNFPGFEGFVTPANIFTTGAGGNANSSTQDLKLVL